MATTNLGRVVGLSAYEVWLGQLGNAGKTEQEYIAFLKQEAVDIAAQVSAAELLREIAEGLRETALDTRLSGLSFGVGADGGLDISYTY